MNHDICFKYKLPACLLNKDLYELLILYHLIGIASNNEKERNLIITSNQYDMG
jgi:hypothetical protein